MKRLPIWLLAATCVMLLTGTSCPAAMAAETCPTPRCYKPGATESREFQAETLLSMKNRGSVRFSGGWGTEGSRRWMEQELGFSPAIFDEYILTTSSAPDSVTLSMSDGRGRSVHSATAATPEAVADAMTPLIEIIRDHQRTVREEEHTAVDAWIYANPKSAEIEVDETVEVSFELIDCDGYELFDRTVEIELAGPGSVEPAVVTTDEHGRGEFTFTSKDPGRAVITLWYVYEAIETEGVMSANGDHQIVVDIEGEGVRSLLEFSGDGYRAEYDAWNCTGIEGDWKLEGELEVLGYGTISGGGTFYVPPRPEEGPWESEAFSYTMQGTLDMDGARAEIAYEFTDVVFTVIELEDGPTLGDSRGTSKATVTVVTPDFTTVVSETFGSVSLAPSVIRKETHPSCQ